MATVHATTDAIDYGDLINKAGRQRMLTQRVAKSYFQIGLGANPDLSREQLQRAIELFESQHAELRRRVPNAAIAGGLAVVDELWGPFKETAIAQPSAEQAGIIIELDGPLLAACEHVAQLIERVSGKAYTRFVNISGRQRMLSQRLAKLYMVRASGLGAPWVLSEIDKARNEFSGALSTLKAAPENSATLKELLARVAEQWLWLESALTMEGDAFYPLIVNDASEKILVLMERVTDLYAR